jgi:hypothetical protein
VYLEAAISVQDQYDSQKKENIFQQKGESAFVCEICTTGK